MRSKRHSSKKKPKPPKEAKISPAASAVAASESADLASRPANHSSTPLETLLILCEGPTEAAYFKALAEYLSFCPFAITISPEYPEKDGRALNTLLTKAKKEVNNYDYIWIVYDNDERNAYKLAPEDSKRPIEQLGLGKDEPQVLELLFTKRPLKVLEEEKVKDKWLYFLCEADYEAFLQSELRNISPQMRAKIIHATHKKTELALLCPKEANRHLGAKSKLAKKLRIAYSAIAFEHWILLHFQYSQQAFYNSREYYLYFKQNNFHVPSKGWGLYEERKTLKAFFSEQVYWAWLHSLNLWTHYITPELTSKKAFEINPFSNIHRLFEQLAQIKTLALGKAFEEDTTSFGRIRFEAQAEGWHLSFKAKKSCTIQEIKDIIKRVDSGEYKDLSFEVEPPNFYGQGQDVELFILLEKGRNKLPFIEFYPKKDFRFILSAGQANT